MEKGAHLNFKNPIFIGIIFATPLIRAQEATPAPLEESSRSPAQDTALKHNDDELKVLPRLPEAVVKRDTRSLQNEVYKTIYNRELKNDQREDVLDE
jgi:hypothetical protein